ncbi:hypothetical protein [Paenibacillus sp. JJ-223]|uniref:LexA family protein n=1 Tax=Paenibacillus sp. JJ-223 TaxID=2905647 RepID=UPI001F3590BD|nr:hypothetical protein [Paenibacillus sp. JJ-223]CAH1216005.1 LexA repressor [Paenibacillus sp. JJ-223]
MTTRATLDKPLSRRQQDVYDFVRLYIENNGYGPSIREIADNLMMASVSTAHNHVEKLIRKGYLSNKSGGPRTLTLTKNGNRPKVVSQSSIMKWIDRQMNNYTGHDALAYAMLTDLKTRIESGRIC